VWEALPSQVRIELESGWVSNVAGLASGGASESKSGIGASLLPDDQGDQSGNRSSGPVGRTQSLLRGREAIVFDALRQDVALQMDEILDLVETQLSSSEVFTALFELELAGRIRSLPGKNFVRLF
jgi:DNA processing protein